jgi:hypothetical protein
VISLNALNLNSKDKMKRTLILLTACAAMANAQFLQAASLGQAFTYQGQLSDGDQPASGLFDLRFALITAGLAGAQVGAVTNERVWVTNGLFTTELDFGKAAFIGEARWLDIAVRRSNSTNSQFTLLTPRQPLTAAPQALHALAANSADNAGSAASVAWAGVSGKPAGLADNVDNDTQYGAGTGLGLIGTNFSVNFGGDGDSTLAAHSDHKHFGDYWVQNSSAFGLGINNTAGNGLGFLARQGGGSQSGYSSPGLTAGLWGDASGGIGVVGTSKDYIGVFGRVTANSGVNYGVYGTTDSTAGYGVYGNGSGASGVAIKAGGSGIIQSTARSFVFVPGSAAVNASPLSSLRIYASSAAISIFSGEYIGTKSITLPITLPGVLYGQPVTVKGVTVYYLCDDGANNFVTGTRLLKITDADSSAVLIDDDTDRTSNAASTYTLVPGANNTLSSNGSFLSLTLFMTFGDTTKYIRIAGVRIELEHQ